MNIVTKALDEPEEKYKQKIPSKCQFKNKWVFTWNVSIRGTDAFYKTLWSCDIYTSFCEQTVTVTSLIIEWTYVYCLCLYNIQWLNKYCFSGLYVYVLQRSSYAPEICNIRSACVRLRGWLVRFPHCYGAGM